LIALQLVGSADGFSEAVIDEFRSEVDTFLAALEASEARAFGVPAVTTEPRLPAAP